jgi:hypothetical protein
MGIVCRACNHFNGFGSRWCSNCGKRLSDDIGVEGIDTKPVGNEPESPAPKKHIDISLAEAPTPKRDRKFETRYQNGYAVAHGLIATAKGVRVVGIVLGGIIIVYALSTQQFGEAVIGFLGVIVAAVSWVIALVLGAIGQLILAVLDTAVNTSPMLGLVQKEIVLLAGSAHQD